MKGLTSELRARLQATAKLEKKPPVTAAALTATLNHASEIMNMTSEEILQRECESAKIDLDHRERHSPMNSMTVLSYQFSDEELDRLSEGVQFWADLYEESRDPVLRAEWREREAEKRKLWGMEVAW